MGIEALPACSGVATFPVPIAQTGSYASTTFSQSSWRAWPFQRTLVTYLGCRLSSESTSAKGFSCSSSTSKVFPP